MSSLDSINRLTCQPNFDITALEWKNHNRPSSNSDNDLVTLWLIGLVEEESGHEHLEFILNRKISTIRRILRKMFYRFLQ
ncbi:hypothetical protein H311_02855 [Anncaliia algerae PRA109]|nr:hypothetical protein H311_02855 [Anncaliia algerae PRA109]